MPRGRDDGSAVVATELDRYDFELPPKQIAQHPPKARDGARMMVMARSGSARVHGQISDLPGCLREGDLLVVNTTRVVPARLRGRKASGACFMRR